MERSQIKRHPIPPIRPVSVLLMRVAPNNPNYTFDPLVPTLVGSLGEINYIATASLPDCHTPSIEVLARSLPESAAN